MPTAELVFFRAAYVAAIVTIAITEHQLGGCLALATLAALEATTRHLDAASQGKKARLDTQIDNVIASVKASHSDLTRKLVEGDLMSQELISVLSDKVVRLENKVGV